MRTHNPPHFQAIVRYSGKVTQYNHDPLGLVKLYSTNNSANQCEGFQRPLQQPIDFYKAGRGEGEPALPGSYSTEPRGCGAGRCKLWAATAWLPAADTTNRLIRSKREDPFRSLVSLRERLHFE